MKKKLMAIFMAGAMCISFCACGNDGGSTEETVELTTVAEDQQEDESISVYHKIYDEYAEKMDKVGKDGGEIKTLDKIFEEGKDRMKDAMLSSSDDDQNTYEKWFAKLSEKYAEVARSLTD